MSTPNCHVEEAIHRAGGVSATARALGVSRQAVNAWKKRGIPATRVRSLTELVAHTVTPEQLRPDIFGQPASREA
jgi:DNA-binding transcriptional regulator YdaS (Cro superfamily)